MRATAPTDQTAHHPAEQMRAGNVRLGRLDLNFRLYRSDRNYPGGTEVFFYTFRGILDNYSGFVYRSDGSSPTGGMEQYREGERLTEAWYWVASS